MDAKSVTFELNQKTGLKILHQPSGNDDIASRQAVTLINGIHTRFNEALPDYQVMVHFTADGRTRPFITIEIT